MPGSSELAADIIRPRIGIPLVGHAACAGRVPVERTGVRPRRIRREAREDVEL
jgi:hypothetical protein